MASGARTRRTWALVGVVTGLLVGCGARAPEVGSERGACRSDGTCAAGLQCLSKVCVEVAGARCAQVGQRARALVREGLRTRPLLGAAVGARADRLADLVTTACTDDHWSSAAQRCVLDAGDHDRVEACLGDLPPGPRAALARREDELAAAGDRVEHDPPVDDPPAPPDDLGGNPLPRQPPPPPSVGPTQLGPACAAYLALLTRYSTCPALPAQARTSIADAVTTLRRTFTDAPTATRVALEDGCRQAATAMTGAITQLGCP